MQIKVASKADKKLNIVCNFSTFVTPAKTRSETAKETIKTTIGSKKARITLSTTESPEALPNCS